MFRPHKLLLFDYFGVIRLLDGCYITHILIHSMPFIEFRTLNALAGAISMMNNHMKTIPNVNGTEK